jgi:hypothetical protein
MSTEPKQVEKPSQQMHAQHVKEKEELETTSLGTSLIHGWTKFKAGQLISYKWMGIILIAIAAVFVTLYILSERGVANAQRWMELENANSRAALTEFAERNPNTLAGNVAEMDLARFLLGPDGVDRIPASRDDNERKTAIENVEKARELMTKLIDPFKDQPILKAQCYAGLAKSEAAFIGLTKPGSLESLGSMDKLIDLLDKLAEAADGTPWGDDAKKLSSQLKSGGTAKTELVEVQRKVYILASPFGGDGPKFPGKSPLDSIPGLPGSTPTPPTPPMPPPITPDPPKKEGDPKPPTKDGPVAPKKDEPKAPEAPKKDAPKAPEAPKKDEPKAPEAPKKM